MSTEFPEHAKMSDKFWENEAIYDFFEYLRTSGLFLARYDPLKAQIVGVPAFETLQSAVLKFRGVDERAYRLEGEALKARYPHIFEQVAKFLQPAERPTERSVEVTRIDTPIVAATREPVKPSDALTALNLMLDRTGKDNP
jgi:erythromycin esterase-like protein